GYDKHIRLLRDAWFVSTADRVRLGCYGIAGGMAGLPYQASVDGRTLPGGNDDTPMPAGRLLRLRPAGGGGGGAPPSPGIRPGARGGWDQAGRPNEATAGWSGTVRSPSSSARAGRGRSSTAAAGTRR